MPWRNRLAEDGVVAVNVGRTHTDYSLVDAIAATMQQVFPSVYIVDEPDNGSPLGNSMVVATRQPTTLADFNANLPAFDHPLLAEVARRAASQVRLWPRRPARRFSPTIARRWSRWCMPWCWATCSATDDQPNSASAAA